MIQIRPHPSFILEELWQSENLPANVARVPSPLCEYGLLAFQVQQLLWGGRPRSVLVPPAPSAVVVDRRWRAQPPPRLPPQPQLILRVPSPLLRRRRQWHS